MSSDFEVSAAARQLREMWERKVWADRPLGPGWNNAFADWIEKFGFGRVADAVQMAATPRLSEEGERLPPDIRDVPKYAAVELAEDKEPGMRDCYLVRGRMRLKFNCHEDDKDVLSLLRRVKRAGVSPSQMHRAVDESDTLEDSFVAMGIDRLEFRVAMGQTIVDLPPKGHVFIREEDPEWLIWNTYLRQTTGKGAPMNKHFGWFFPSRLPPSEPPKRRRRPNLAPR